ncbi:MAG: ribonuclease III [Defluviitaleaceae bacterium]|nr:ribonuclease III [Defluviitaleaceae bacterium]
MNAAALAYLGDAVFELCAREMLIAQGLPAHKAHRRAKDIVSATAQASMYHRIYPKLTPDEQTIMRRGRNLNPMNRARNAETSDYRHATGIEALFGYLYDSGNSTRIKEIFNLCTSEDI